MASLSARVLQLAVDLRARGWGLGPGEVADALAALESVGVGDRGRVRAALRCTLARHPDALAAFDQLFDRHFGRPGRRPGAARVRAQADGAEDREPGPPQSRSLAARDAALAEGNGRPDPAGVAWRAYSPDPLGRRAEWTPVDPSQGRALRDIARRIARRLTAAPSRRHVPARRGPRLDLRRSLRRSLRHGGEPVQLLRRRRKERLARLVVLCDVSGSMESFARLLLQFVHAVQQAAPRRVEAFAFSTSLIRITPYLRQADVNRALRLAVAAARDWGGGTRIGESLAVWCRLYGGALLGPRTAVLVLSDGLDVGEPELLRQALRRLRAGCRRLIWLNPLAGDPRYRPLAQGMRVALPFLDALLPAHDLASLAAIERHLG